MYVELRQRNGDNAAMDQLDRDGGFRTSLFTLSVGNEVNEVGNIRVSRAWRRRPTCATNGFSTFLLPGKPPISWLNTHPQVQRAQFCNNFRRFFPGSASGRASFALRRPAKLNRFRVGWSVPQKSIPAAFSVSGLYVGTTTLILTHRIRQDRSSFRPSYSG